MMRKKKAKIQTRTSTYLAGRHRQLPYGGRKSERESRERGSANYSQETTTVAPTLVVWRPWRSQKGKGGREGTEGRKGGRGGLPMWRARREARCGTGEESKVEEEEVKRKTRGERSETEVRRPRADKTHGSRLTRVYRVGRTNPNISKIFHSEN